MVQGGDESPSTQIQRVRPQNHRRKSSQPVNVSIRFVLSSKVGTSTANRASGHRQYTVAEIQERSAYSRGLWVSDPLIGVLAYALG